MLHFSILSLHYMLSSSIYNNSFVRHQIDKLKFVCALQIVISDFLLKANNSVFFVKAYI